MKSTRCHNHKNSGGSAENCASKKGQPVPVYYQNPLKNRNMRFCDSKGEKLLSTWNNFQKRTGVIVNIFMQVIIILKTKFFSLSTYPAFPCSHSPSQVSWPVADMWANSYRGFLRGAWCLPSCAARQCSEWWPQRSFLACSDASRTPRWRYGLDWDVCSASIPAGSGRIPTHGRGFVQKPLE